MNSGICFVIPSLALGGSERSLIKLTKVLAKDAQQITIVTFADQEHNKSSSELDESIKVVSLGGLRSINPLLWFRTWLVIKRMNPVAVVGWSTYANLVVSLLSLINRSWYLILSERDYLPIALATIREQHGLRRSIVLAAMRHLYPHADLITANSQENLKFLRRYLHCSAQYRLLPNSIDIKKVDRLCAESTSNLPEVSGLRVLAIARLEHQKGIDILLRAFALVRGSRAYNLVVVGDGSKFQDLKSLADSLGISQSVFWLGSRIQPFPYYAWADIVVVPSRHEGFPNVPLEAMACGKAVICANCKTGPRELTVNGVYGRLVPVEDVTALAREIIKLGDNEEQRIRLGRSARTHIERNYDIEVLAESLKEGFVTE